MKVYTIIVTYNRLEWLKKVIESVRKQSQEIDKIVIVNNSSNDGTTEWLQKQETLHIINQENSGGAGGFHSGIKYAYENGADWIWTMDDDIFPNEDCLKVLLSYTIFSKCLQPTRRFSDGVLKVWNKHFNLKTNKVISLDDCLVDIKEVTFVNTCCFEGMLIHRDIVEKIGYPDARFFIAGDDTIYGFLANLHTNVCNVRDAVMIRQKQSTDLTFSPMYSYYTFRNFHLFQDYYAQFYSCKKYPFTIRLKNFLLVFYNITLTLSHPQASLTMKYKISIAIFRGYIDSVKKKEYKSF